MVTKQEKQNMKDFVYSFVQDISKKTQFNYVENGSIRSYDGQAEIPNFIISDPNEERSKFYFLVIDENKDTEKKSSIIKQLKYSDWNVPVPIYFKNKNNFFIRLADNESWRTDKSLKNYTTEEINRMLRLRDLEKIGLNNCSLFNSPTLVYYQPKTERLEESVRTFETDRVILDYTHLPRESLKRSYTGDTSISKDYKLINEVPSIETIVNAIESKRF